MGRLIDEKKLINYIKTEINPYGRPFEGTVFEFGCKVMEYIENMEKVGEWIPIKWHETTDDESLDKERYPLCLDCEMPEDGQEIVVCRKNGYVCVDTCIYDDGYSLDSGCDWIDDVIAWMPLPEPYDPNTCKNKECPFYRPKQDCVAKEGLSDES